MRKTALIAGVMLSGATGCTPAFVYPGTQELRGRTAVAASFDRTWETAVSYFAERNIAIRTIEKASGIIVAEPGRANLANRHATANKYAPPDSYDPIYADCGSRKGYWPPEPTAALYNVRVLGDDVRSSVQVNARFISSGYTANPGPLDCRSTGKWESDIETYIKANAEAK